MTLKEARKKSGLTQRELAERVGMIQSEISRIERDGERVTVRLLNKVAKGMNMRVKVSFELCD